LEFRLFPGYSNPDHLSVLKSKIDSSKYQTLPLVSSIRATELLSGLSISVYHIAG